jgi:4-hydroxy-3-polyprenylbenzoate decarboxylase
MSDEGVIVGISGATGAIYGVRLLERLRELEVPTHLVLSTWGKRTIEHETSYTVPEVEAMASSVEGYANLAATISSGSFPTRGMVIAPCTVKTLAAIAAGLADNLMTRAADVVLKERRRLVLVVRETPLHEIHLENMLRLTRMGAVMFPPVPSFYNNPETIEELVDFTVARVLDQLDLQVSDVQRWDGRMRRRAAGNQDG